MQELQVTYQIDLRVKITSQRSIHCGKTGIIRGICCAGHPDKEQYLVHIEDDLDCTQVYHFLAGEIVLQPHLSSTEW